MDSWISSPCESAIDHHMYPTNPPKQCGAVISDNESIKAYTRRVLVEKTGDVVAEVEIR